MATSVPVVPEKLGKARGVPFTLFYDDEKDLEPLIKYANENDCYMVFGYEICPTTQRKHAQGYVHWENPRSLQKFKDCISKKLHLTLPVQGSADQNRAYCLKLPPHGPPNERFFESGECPRQGERSDWKAALSQVMRGTDIIDVIQDQPHLLPCVRQLERVQTLRLKPRHREVEVVVLYGAPGTGKTRYVYDNFKDIYSKPRGDWWDGYIGQEVILLDDFYGYISYSELLRVLDRYPYQAAVKGSFVQAQWTKVFITSNKPPSEWYSTPLDQKALERRIKKIVFYNINGTPQECSWQGPQGS